MSFKNYNAALLSRLVLALLLFTIVGTTAEARNKHEYRLRRDQIRIGSQLQFARLELEGRLTDDERFRILRQESIRLFENYTEFRKQQSTSFVPFIGQAVLADNYPISTLPDGATSILTFVLINPDTGLVVAGPTVGSVLYEVNLDPSTPDLYIQVGTSFDVASNFSLPFTVSGFEPVIRATPFDLAGNQIIIPGVDGFDVAEGDVVNLSTPVPEPTSMVLLGTGLAGISMTMRKKFKSRKSRKGGNSCLCQF